MAVKFKVSSSDLDSLNKEEQKAYGSGFRSVWDEKKQNIEEARASGEQALGAFRDSKLSVLKPQKPIMKSLRDPNGFTFGIGNAIKTGSPIVKNNQPTGSQQQWAKDYTNYKLPEAAAKGLGISTEMDPMQFAEYIASKHPEYKSTYATAFGKAMTENGGDVTAAVKTVQDSFKGLIDASRTEGQYANLQYQAGADIVRALGSIDTYNALTDDEKKLCFSMTKRTSGDFESMIAKLVRQSGLENELNEVLLKRFANVELERSIDETNNTLRVARAALEDNVAEYARLVQKVNDATIKYEALLARPKNESTELVDYFKRHKNLQLVNVSDGTIKFYVKTTADWFDLDFYRRASSNGSIYRMTADPPFCKVEDRKLLMDAIFSDDPVFRIRLCAIYALNTDVAVFRNYEYPEELTRQYLPNPHLQYHQCLGSYRDPIRTAIRNSNYIGAIEQCVASCQSINLAETGVTFIPFMKRLFATTKKEKVLIDKDGNEYNAKEALEKLKEQK